jgi:16S rRNA (cytidine1402-2'-O)-methyltransferase
MKPTSIDYPFLAQKLIEASGEMSLSKPSSGLYVVATPIGHRGDITLRALVTLAAMDLIACEDTRVSGALLKSYGIKARLISYHDHNAEAQRPQILRHLQDGHSVALISDAGMPLIADPGFRLVCAVREAGYPVTVIPGANAALTALAGSGLPSDHFFFAGFLPPKSTARRQALSALKSIPATLICYETAPRLAASLADCAAILGATRQAAVARELTKKFEETRRGALGELAAHYAAHTVKGEIVLLFGPPTEDEKPSHDLAALLQDHLARLSLRDAVAAVSVLTGEKKNIVYAAALRLGKKSSND